MNREETLVDILNMAKEVFLRDYEKLNGQGQMNDMPMCLMTSHDLINMYIKERNLDIIEINKLRKI